MPTSETPELVRTPGMPRPGRMLFLGAVLLICLGAVLPYLGSLHAPFYFDDTTSILRNESVTGADLTVGGLRTAAFENKIPRPLAYLSFALNHIVGGAEPAGYRVVNIAIHTLTSLVVFLFAIVLGRHERLFGSQDGRFVLLFAFGAAMLFAVHPIQTQSVTYIVQRMTSMCALFYLLALLSFWMGRSVSSSSRWVWWFGTLICWVLALATKQFAVTLPAAILLLEWFFWRDADPKWRMRGAMWAGGAALAVLGIALVFKGPSGIERLLTRGYGLRDFTLVERVLTQPRVLVHYLSLVVWPVPSRLTLVYDYPLSTSLVSPLWTLPALFGVVGAGVLSILFARRAFLLAFAVLWFLLHLAVESSVIPLEMVYEHRMYLPMVGLCLLASAGVIRGAKHPGLVIAVLAVVCSLLALGTHARNQVWNNPLEFWADNRQKSPSEARVSLNWALENMRQQESEAALEGLSQALDLDPNLQPAYVRRGTLRMQAGDLRGAMSDFTRAIEMPVDEATMRVVIYDEAYAERGLLRSDAGDARGAIEDLSRAIAIRDDRAAYFERRGLAHIRAGELRAAIGDLERAIRMDPQQWPQFNNLAWILATSADPALLNGSRAVELATRACELTEWSNPSTISTLAASSARAGAFEQAVRWQERCIELAPDPAAAARYRERLALYRSGMPYTQK